MPEPKVPLPPFAALRAFHAAATHARFREAAAHLGVTESAVSHQIRRLEVFLHTALFDRAATGVRLTAAGRRYLEQIDPAIRQIQAATEAVLRPTGRQVVRLTLPPSLAATWLIPKLGAFERDHPDMELQLVPTTRVLDLKRDQVELAVRHGKGVWPGIEATFLLEEKALPVCAPGYLRPDEDPAMGLQRARLIVNARFPDEWEEWSRARGLAPRRLPARSSSKASSRRCRSPRAATACWAGGPWLTTASPGTRSSPPSAPATRRVPRTICAGSRMRRRPPPRAGSSAGCGAWPLRRRPGLLEFPSSRPEANSLATAAFGAYVSCTPIEEERP